MSVFVVIPFYKNTEELESCKAALENQIPHVLIVQEDQTAPDPNGLRVVRGHAQAPGQDRPHLALGFLQQARIAHPVEDLAHDEIVGPRERPESLQGGGMQSFRPAGIFCGVAE